MSARARKLAVALGLALLLPSAAGAQTVQYSGPITRNHIPVWISPGVIGDAGSSNDSPVSSIGVTNNGGTGFCVNSDRSTAAGRNQLCFAAATNAAATISLQNFGTATPQGLNFIINGTSFPFPGSLSSITIGTTPVNGGSNGLCLFISGSVVGQQVCTLSAITSLNGDVIATGPGASLAALASVNANPGPCGSAAAIPIATINAKGLTTSCTTVPPTLTVGTTTITSGSNNGMLYDNGGVIGNLTTLGNALLVTSAGGVPLMATTLPAGLTMPSPTFSGTLTFPDAATWNVNGLSKVAALSAGSATIPSGGNVNISGQYQVNGAQIAAGNLSNGTTGTGAVVLAASPTLSGTVGGNVTLSGNLTLSGNDTHSGQLIATGTSAPASGAGNTAIMGTIAAPTLVNNGQAFLFNTAINGAALQGAGSTSDIALLNKSGTAVISVPTGTTKLNFPSLASGTCSSGLGLDSSNNTILISCPGAASSIQVGTTSIASGSSGNIEFNNAGTLGEVTPQNGVGVVSTGLVGTEAVNAQTGTSSAILNADRGKLITANNTAAQAYTIAQAGTGGSFAAGWFADIRNINSLANPAGIVTITPATSTINGAASYPIYPGYGGRLVSDGTNYQLIPYNPGQPMIQVVEQQPVNTGTSNAFTSGSFQSAVLNTKPVDDVGVTLSGNAITNLPAGTYSVFGSVPFADTTAGDCAVRLRDTTTPATLLNGQMMTSRAANSVACQISGRFTIAAAKNVQMQLFFDAGVFTAASMNDGEVNIYSTLTLLKVN